MFVIPQLTIYQDADVRVDLDLSIGTIADGESAMHTRKFWIFNFTILGSIVVERVRKIVIDKAIYPKSFEMWRIIRELWDLFCRNQTLSDSPRKKMQILRRT